MCMYIYYICFIFLISFLYFLSFIFFSVFLLLCVCIFIFFNFFFFFSINWFQFPFIWWHCSSFSQYNYCFYHHYYFPFILFKQMSILNFTIYYIIYYCSQRRVEIIRKNSYRKNCQLVYAKRRLEGLSRRIY